MPVHSSSDYRPPFPFVNCHMQTIFPNLFRRVGGVSYKRRRLTTPDGDFLDLDFSSVRAQRIAIVVHGLEGNSYRPYVLGMVRALNRAGWDAAAINLRGCSGEPNRNLRFYHSGDSGDLRSVVKHLLGTHAYRRIDLIGFSLGGNIVLKYLGEEAGKVNPAMAAAVVFSTPCDLRSSAMQMGLPSNRLYMVRFLKLLHGKIRQKAWQFPGRIDDNGYQTIRTFKEFDDRYAPVHGFANAEDYYEKASSKPFLQRIAIPVLVIDAADDPFLPRSCYPVAEARDNPLLYLEIPKHGGHVGFVSFRTGGVYWSESRAVEFLTEHAL